MGRSTSFVRVSGGSRKERETGIFQRLKIRGSYLTLKRIGVICHVRKTGGSTKRFFIPWGKTMLLSTMTIVSEPRSGGFFFFSPKSPSPAIVT